ncbi:helix-turn-helix domain-containing protein [Virgibacillus halophilus]|uniref:Helix-turn-helix domain-containing protein n=1 Tax=Tigheibacillus halophilus TaxID=361280 RepID=A0ABU5CAP5_9BACI|nr:helix-turn-helix domain-containing protein [Virgibacillus halophilus]
MLLHKPLRKMPLEDKIIKAQQGDEQLMNELLKTYQPFIAKCVSEVCKRYIDTSRDDEFSVGLFAFHNAIQTYRPDRGSSFFDICQAGDLTKSHRLYPIYKKKARKRFLWMRAMMKIKWKILWK